MELDPKKVYPNEKLRNICYIKNTVTRDNVVVGDYTYLNNPDGKNFENDCVVYHYKELGDKLIIGKFCSLGENIKFIMNAANHNFRAVTAYPFTAVLSTAEGVNEKHLSELPFKGDTVVGNDVWIGENVTILPGVHIGDGAVIGADSVVAKDIPPYAVAAGNPCEVKKKRFDDEFISYLLDLKWWDWDIDKILGNLDKLCGGDPYSIKNV